MEQLSPIDTAPLFSGLHRQLMALLRQLDLEDWNRPTVAGSWKVRDVVAHLIDVQLRRANEAWRIFFNAASGEEARSLASCSGDPDLCDALLQLRSVMV